MEKMTPRLARPGRFGRPTGSLRDPGADRHAPLERLKGRPRGGSRFLFQRGVTFGDR